MYIADCTWCPRNFLHAYHLGFLDVPEDSGQGEKVERIYREVRAYAIPGGSEEIMLNLAASQLKFVKQMAPDPRDVLIKKLQQQNSDFKKLLDEMGIKQDANATAKL